MKSIFVSSILIGLIGLIQFPTANSAVIDFESLPAGSHLSILTSGNGITGPLDGSVTVFGFNPAFGIGTNAAIVFDSDCSPGSTPADCSGGDVDLGSPNQDFGGPGLGSGGECCGDTQNDSPLHKIAIIAEDLNDSEPDGLVDDPDDENLEGVYLELDFSSVGDGTVTVNQFTYIDREVKELGPQFEFYGPGTLNPSTVAIESTGDNGVRTITTGIQGVTRMVAQLNGSGALDSIVINEEVIRDCWVTMGGFNTSTVLEGKGSKGKKYCTFGGNIGPPPSGALQTNWHQGAMDGAKFHTNSIESVQCIDMGSTGPQQPGGKKGLEVDTLLFTCTGQYTAAGDSVSQDVTCNGFLKDGGEPAGKKGNDYDRIRLVVHDSVGDILATCGDVDLDDPLDGSKLVGGNVQIHPPVGKP